MGSDDYLDCEEERKTNKKKSKIKSINKKVLPGASVRRRVVVSTSSVYTIQQVNIKGLN